MSSDIIGIHLRLSEASTVRQAVAATLAAAGFQPVEEDEEAYAVIVTEATEEWVSVLVADWPDSGALARGLSARLAQPVLELWVSENIHWGYTFYEGGTVLDRFTDNPRMVAETPAEQALYAGCPDALAPLLRASPARAAAVLAAARQAAGQFAAASVDAFADCLGLPLDQAFLGFDDFADGDPEDLPLFQLLTFQPPLGREGLDDGKIAFREP